MNSNRNELAFTCLVEDYSIPIYNLCFHLLGEAALAEEAALHSFCCLYRKFSRQDPAQFCRVDLYAAACRTCLDLLHQRRQPEAVERSLSEYLPPQPLPLQALLNTLSPENRAIVWLHYRAGFTHQEIARVVGLPLNTIENRLQQARKTMALGLCPVITELHPQPLTGAFMLEDECDV